MNHAVMLDASIAIKRVLDEPFTEQARAIFDHSLRERRPILAPTLMLSEVTNALYQRTRTTVSEYRITEAEAEDALAAFLHLPIVFLSPPDLYRRALVFARTHRLRATYDSIYVVLAQMEGVELWTGDERLINSIRSVAPWVRWIGDYS